MELRACEENFLQFPRRKVESYMRALYLNKVFLKVVFFSFVFSIYSAGFAQAETRELVLLNWSEYMDPELIAKFEKQFNVEVNEVYFESDDLRDAMLLETEVQGYDLALVNDLAVDVYRIQGWLAPVDTNYVPNLKHIEERWLDAFAGVRGFAMPYFWGTLGIAYRSDLIEKAPSSWMDFFKPTESVRGKIGLIESSTEVIGMALKALGYSANSNDARAIDEAEELLLAQKPFVKSYVYIALNEQSALVSGDIAITMIYSGDALMVQEHHEMIEYVVPKEGGTLWADYLVVMKNSMNKDLAWAFINFLNEPEHAAQLAQYVYYATPNKAAEKILPADFLENEVIYPTEEALAKSEPFQPIPPRVQKKRSLVFARLLE